MHDFVGMKTGHPRSARRGRTSIGALLLAALGALLSPVRGGYDPISRWE